MAKGGWLSSGGSAIGGHGNYLGAAVEAYFIPELGIRADVDWAQHLTGQGQQVLGRTGINSTVFGIEAEYLFLEDYGLSGFANYAHNSNKIAGASLDANAWRVGLRMYFGGGSRLFDRSLQRVVKESQSHFNGCPNQFSAELH